MDAHSIVFNKDSVTYSYFAIEKTLYYRDITRIEVNYIHKRIRTIAPVLHIREKDNEIEIPYGLFETKFELIHQMIHNKVNR
jgi:hypothetical protein